MKVIIVVLLLCSTMASAQKNVHLKGRFVSLGTNEVSFDYDGVESFIMKTGDFIVHTDDEGYFDTIMPLSEPAFFRVNKNTVYLSPGDDLDIYITDKNSEAVYKGRGAEANNYMKNRLFPKEGSFLWYLRGRKDKFEVIKRAVDSLAELKKEELRLVKNVSDEFRKLEYARIIGDIANSYIRYPHYCSDQKFANQDEFVAFFESIIPELLQLLPQIGDIHLQDVAVVRETVELSLQNPKLSEMVEIPELTRELCKAKEYARLMDYGGSPETMQTVGLFLDNMKNVDIKKILQLKWEATIGLQEGKEAINLELITPKGEVEYLEQYKGKVIYLDFWATWCVPCLREKPIFHELAKKYKDDNIVFLSVSTDLNKKRWLRHITDSEMNEYNCVDAKNLEGWQVKYIPRFLLIDKDFKIVNAYAPKPSQPEIEALINSVLGK